MNIKTLKKESKRKSFSLLAGINRPVNPSQVTKLAKSIDKMGVIRPVVIAKISFVTGKPTEYIIDGQHLYHALIRNEMDIPYTEIQVEDEKDLVEKIALLNASSKSWTLVDYVTAWSAVYPDYKKLAQYYNTYDLELSQLASILHRGVSFASGGSSTTSSRIIKSGSFRIKKESEKITMLNCITDVLKHVPRLDRVSNKTFIYSYVQFYVSYKANYNHDEFLKWLDKNKSKLVLATQDETEIIKLLEKSIK